MRIAITGIGAISAIGRNCAETLQSLLNEQSGIGSMRVLGSVHKELPVGEVPFSDAELKQMAGIDLSEPMPRTALLGLLAAREAMQQAGLQHTDRCAFISGTTVGGMDLTEQHLHHYAQGQALDHIRLHEADSTTRTIASHLSPFAFTATPSTACSSALNAVLLGANMLRTGQAKAAVVGGAESLSKFHLNGFNTLMILSHEPCRPFDANRNGLNLGEGAGYMVLEREEDAKIRGAVILGYISGYANTCDAYHQTASSENGEGAYLAMKGALEMAGLTPGDIDYINAHAFTGHTTSASGGLEAAICVLAMQHGFIPSNLHWSETAEGLVQPVLHTEHKPLHHVLCNAFGFGGNESSLVLSLAGTDLSETALPSSLTPIAAIEELDDSAVSQMVSGAEARRMTPQMRCIVAAARMVLQQTGITPDAILCETEWGCMAQSMRFLQDMRDNDEQQLKPTPFIQSTHNTVASLIAILTGNHGYNATYARHPLSPSAAMMDIRTQMALGQIRSALVLQFDEQVESWDRVLAQVGDQMTPIAHAYIYKV